MKNRSLSRALAHEVRTLPSVYWTLWWGVLVNKAGGFVLPFLALYVTAQGGSEADAGSILSLYGAGAVLAGFTGGVLADRVGRRATMLLSMFGGAAALLGMGVSTSLGALGVTTFAMGWMAELYRPAVSAAVADVVVAAERARAYAHLYWVHNFGYALAPTLAGLVASFSYFALFAIDAATLLGFGLIVLWRVPETRPVAPVGDAGAAADARGLRTVFTDRVFMAFALLTLGLGVVMWQGSVTLPLEMKSRGISAGSYGLLMGLNGVMIILLQPLLTPWLRRFSRTWVLSVAALFFAVGFGLYAFVATPSGYALAIAIWTLGEIAALPTSSAVVADLAEPTLRGRYQGVNTMAWGISSFVGPLAGGALLASAGGATLWGSCFALMVLVALGHVLLGRARAQREQLAVHTAT